MSVSFKPAPLSRLPLVMLAVAAAWLGLAMTARGQSDVIHHCVDARGQPVFTDRTCASMQATPAPELSRAAPAPGVSISGVIVAESPTPLRPLPVLCADSVDQLRQQLIDAFAARDPNRLAGLMLWNGYSERGVVQAIRSLGALMRQPLLGVTAGDGSTAPDPVSGTDIYDASAPLGSMVDAAPATPSSADDASTAEDARQLTVETPAQDGGGAVQQTRFAIVNRAGCRWLRRLD